MPLFYTSASCWMSCTRRTDQVGFEYTRYRLLVVTSCVAKQSGGARRAVCAYLWCYSHYAVRMLSGTYQVATVTHAVTHLFSVRRRRGLQLELNEREVHAAFTKHIKWLTTEASSCRNLWTLCCSKNTTPYDSVVIVESTATT